MNKRLMMILLGLSVLSFLGMAVLYPSLPQVIPTHFAFDGTVNGTGHKRTIFLMGGMPIVFSVMFWVLPKIDPRRKNYEKHQKAYSIINGFLTIFCILCGWSMVLAAKGYDLKIQLLLPIGLGLMFIVIGNFMPQFRPNYFMGIRTPWALDNEYVWRKTHKFGGICFCIMGIVFAATPFLPGKIHEGILFAALMAGIVGTYLYSYMVYRKMRQEKKE